MTVWEKLGKIIAKILEYLWDVFIWALVFGVAYLIFVLGGMEGSILDRIKQIPAMIRSGSLSSLPSSSLSVDYYTILIGSSGSRDGAERLVQEARRKRIHAKIIVQGNRHFVVSGKYMKRSQAEPRLKTIRSKGFGGARIIEPK